MTDPTSETAPDGEPPRTSERWIGCTAACAATTGIYAP